MLATWSVRELAEQTLVIPAQASDVAAVEQEVAAGAGGVILFGDTAPPGLAASLTRLGQIAPRGIAPFVMVDEEGGAVQRISNVVGKIPSARYMGATMTAAEIKTFAQSVGQKLRAVGVTMDLAPVLDVDAGPGPSTTAAIGTRSFSGDDDTAATAGLAFAAGLQAGGIVPVVKHFPGIGGTGNTDVAPASTAPWSTLQNRGLKPFVAAVRAGVPAVMVSNASVPGLTDRPASISPAVTTEVLRHQLGFDGLVLTDSLSAGALSARGISVPRASVDALVAGADMVLFNAASTTLPTVTANIVDAVSAAVASGKLTKARLVDAVSHILKVKHVDLCR